MLVFSGKQVSSLSTVIKCNLKSFVSVKRKRFQKQLLNKLNY